jgi:hypothetical protein
MTFWYENSNGLVELAVNQGRADHELGLTMGIPIEIVPSKLAGYLRSWSTAMRETSAMNRVRSSAASSTGDLVTLGDHRLCAASAYELGDLGSDRATAADHHALARTHSATASGTTSEF